MINVMSNHVLGLNLAGRRRRRTRRGGSSHSRSFSRQRTISIMITSSARVGLAVCIGASSGMDHRCSVSLEHQNNLCVLLCHRVHNFFFFCAVVLASGEWHFSSFLTKATGFFFFFCNFGKNRTTINELPDVDDCILIDSISSWSTISSSSSF